MRRNLSLLVALMLIVVAVAQREALLRFILVQTLAHSVGDRASIGALTSHNGELRIRALSIDRDGFPLARVAGIAIDYSLRDLLPGSRHRFGVTSVRVVDPRIDLVREKNGALDVPIWSQNVGWTLPSPPQREDEVPLAFRAQVVNGEISVHDVRHPGRVFRLTQLAVDGIVASNAHSVLSAHAAIDGDAHDTLQVRAQSDRPASVAQIHLVAGSLPLTPLIDAAIGSPAFTVDAGRLDNLDVQLASYTVRDALPVEPRLAMRGDIRDARVGLEWLTQPFTALRARITATAGQVSLRGVRATLAGRGVRADGALFAADVPRLALHAQTTADLAQIKEAVAFAQHLPVSGDATLTLDLAGRLALPRISIHAKSRQLQYDGVPLADATADVALHDDRVTVLRADAMYGHSPMTLVGAIRLGAQVTSRFWLHSQTTADRLPYAQMLLGRRLLDVNLELHGHDLAFGAAGSITDAFDVTRAHALLRAQPEGRFDVTDLRFRAQHGIISGGYRLDRPTQSSDLWLLAQNFPVVPANPDLVPGANLGSQLEFAKLPIAGRLAGAVALRTGPHSSSLAGRAWLLDGSLAGLAVRRAEATVRGSLSRFGLIGVHVNGAWGKFKGAGLYSAGQLDLRGAANVDLAQLPEYFDGVPASGHVVGPVALGLKGSGLQLALLGAQTQQVVIDGVPIRGLAGNVRLGSGGIDVGSLEATLGRGRLIASGSATSRRGLAFVAVGVPSSALRRLGLPLESGQADAQGVLHSTKAGVDVVANAVLHGGRANGRTLAGSATLHYANGNLHIAQASGRLGGIPGQIQGNIFALGPGTPQYSLQAVVTAGEVTAAARLLGLPTRPVSGTFAARLNLLGGGQRPIVSGTVAIPIGLALGQAFHGARAVLYADGPALSLAQGRVRVGSTVTSFSAQSQPHLSAIQLDAASAHLADFNDLFMTGDTLGGNGAVAVNFSSTDHRLATSGRIAVAGLRFRNIDLGLTSAVWRASGNRLTGQLSSASAIGRFDATGSANVVPSSAVGKLLARSRIHLRLAAHDLDASTWAAILGQPTLPLLGRINGRLQADGRYPELSFAANGQLVNGSWGSLPIQMLTARLATRGGSILLKQADLSAAGLSAQAAGSFGWTARAPLSLTLHAGTKDVQHAVAGLFHRSLPLLGGVEATLSVRGSAANPVVNGAVDTQNFQAYGVSIPSLVASARLAGTGLEISDVEANFGVNGRATLAGTLPLRLGRSSDAVSFDLVLDHLNARVFEPLLPGKTQIAGQLDGHIGLLGTLGSPRALGSLDFVGGTLSTAGGFAVKKLSATLGFNGTQANLTQVSAGFGSGGITGRAQADLASLFTPGGPVFSAQAHAADAQLTVPGVGHGQLDGSLTLVRGTSDIATLAGDLRLSNAAVPFAAFLGATQGVPRGRLPALAFDLTFHADHDVRVVGTGYGAGLDVAATGRVKLAGTLAAPSLDGVFSSDRGTLLYVDRAFNVARATLSFTPENGLVPNLFAVAGTNITNPDPNRQLNPTGSTDITVVVRGPIDQLRVALRSNPAGYTQDQILAMLTPFGGFATNLNFDASGPASTFGMLRGAPATSFGQPLPGVQGGTLGSLTVGQEAFNVINAQFTAGLLAPLGNAIGNALGVGQVGVGVDYFGNFSIAIHKALGRGFAARYSASLGQVSEQSLALEYAPNSSTIAELAFYTQTVSGSVVTGARPGFFGPVLPIGVPVQSGSGFSFTLKRLFGWRKPGPARSIAPQGEQEAVNSRPVPSARASSAPSGACPPEGKGCS